jgi:hypothetical protein
MAHNGNPRAIFLSGITSHSLKSILFGMEFFDGATHAEDFDEAFIGAGEKIGRTLATVQFNLSR